MNGEKPIAGSTQYFTIASGSCSATSSTSMPPFALQMNTGVRVSRSTVIEM